MGNTRLLAKYQHSQLPYTKGCLEAQPHCQKCSGSWSGSGLNNHQDHFEVYLSEVIWEGRYPTVRHPGREAPQAVHCLPHGACMAISRIEIPAACLVGHRKGTYCGVTPCCGLYLLVTWKGPNLELPLKFRAPEVFSQACSQPAGPENAICLQGIHEGLLS